MGDKKGKKGKHIDHDEKKTSEKTGSKKTNISDAFLDELKWAFDKFEEIPDSKKIELYGNDEYLAQFLIYFEKEYPDLFNKIDKKDLPIYMKALEDKKRFSFTNIIKKSEIIHKEFWPEDTEQHVMQKSLDQLHVFCDDNKNNIPADAFSKFASAAGFHPTTHVINFDGKLKTIDDLYPLWNTFLEKEGISLTDTVAERSAGILLPNYNPTERIMVGVALKKIRKELTWKLKTDFDERFPLPIDIFSSYQDIISFKNEWISFLDEHQAEIDGKLAKKLDAIIVTNGDIKKVLLESGRKFDDTKWFSEREQYFRRIFNKLATRQLFEEVQKTQETIDHYLDAMANTFKEFPPYVNEILRIYPFNDKNIVAIDPSFHTDLEHIDMQISDLQRDYSSAPEDQRAESRKQIHALKQEREHRRRQAYIAFLKTKDAALADIFTQLVWSKFDFSVLSPDQQQLLVNTLVKHKLEDTIKNKVPELLSVTEEELTQFMNDLFDLKKMDITIPTRTGPIPLSFVKKEFLSSVRKDLLGIDDLENIQNLPLNFVTQLTDSNAAFFEDSASIFDSIYTDFVARNWTRHRINDAYKVRIKKDGKIVEWYLSSYCPIDEKYNDENYDGKELFLYSEPITAPNKERKLVTREGIDDGTPVIIKHDEQWQCDIEILDRKLNLNGEALWALLFGYVLGQQSREISMSPEKEKELAEKFKQLGKLDVYKEKEEWEEEEPEPVTEKDESKVEKSEYQKFLDDWKLLKWYTFPEEKYNIKGKENFGFVEWTRLFVPFADSELYPKNEGKAWIQLEIVEINELKWTFKVKVHGGELKLWGSEWKTKELAMNASSFEDIRKNFGDIYKLPNTKWLTMDDEIRMVDSWWLAKDLQKKHLGSVKRDGKWFTFVNGDYANDPVTHFGFYEAGIWESHDKETRANYSLYTIKYNPNATVSLSGEFKDGNVIKKYFRDMDYPTFLIFIKEKWLQPKSREQAEDMKNKQKIENQETPTTVRGFSINNIIGFFKNWFTKINDAIKKYDEERTEDLTDALTRQGQLYGDIGKLFGPFSRISSSFETMGAEYYLERDSRIWKKVEKRKKFYEDADFSLIYETILKPMLQWQVTIKPHYKAAAILLAMISKGKWPYSKNPEFAAKGMRVNILMWPAHQQRYLDMREKLTRELEQGSAMYGSLWTDNKKNEILELEMKYIVHVMDGRQLGIQDQDKTKYYFYGKYSKTFIDELEKWYTSFFSQSTVEDWFGKAKGASFEFARGEFFRFLPDRPQQAIPYLRVMATKAMNDSQKKAFEVAVMAGMLSGIFLTMTDSETQWFVQKISRTMWFVPGIRVKDINQQTKLQRMLDIFSNRNFSTSTKYTPEKFSFRDMSGGTKDFVKRDDPTKPWKFEPWTFQTWISKDDTLTKLSKFFKITGGNFEKKTLLDIYVDPKTSPSDKALIEEFLKNTNEKNEALDPEVQKNPSAHTGSILTRSQSAVQQLMKCKNGFFDGANTDENQTMQYFRNNVANEFPAKECSKESVDFYLKKFLNRFEERWFTWSGRTIFVKRLQTVKKLMAAGRQSEAQDILRYSIVGTIVRTLNGAAPQELQKWLEVFMNFFKSNLNQILDSAMVKDVFGPQFVKDSQEPYECGDWYEYIDNLPQNANLAFGAEGKIRGAIKKKYANPNYINRDIYKLAEDLFRSAAIQNRFNNYYVSEKKSDIAKKSSSKATWAKIQNPEVVEKVRQILEGKQPWEISFPIESEDMYENY